MSVTTESGANDWWPGRGDYGTEYAGDLVGVIERFNCVKGCRFAKQANVSYYGYGPGGSCETLAAVFADKGPIPELDPRPEGPHCRKRES